MAHLFHLQAWEMRKLTPWEHDAYVAQTKVELAAIEQAVRDSRR